MRSQPSLTLGPAVHSLPFREERLEDGLKDSKSGLQLRVIWYFVQPLLLLTRFNFTPLNPFSSFGLVGGGQKHTVLEFEMLLALTGSGFIGFCLFQFLILFFPELKQRPSDSRPPRSQPGPADKPAAPTRVRPFLFRESPRSDLDQTQLLLHEQIPGWNFASGSKSVSRFVAIKVAPVIAQAAQKQRHSFKSLLLLAAALTAQHG